MFKQVILFGLAVIASAEEEPVTTAQILDPASFFNQDRGQRYQNQFNPYNPYSGNNFYQQNYKYPGYFNKDYQKYNPGNYYNNNYYNNDFYNKDYYNKNYYNNEYYQKYNQDARNAGILRFVNEAQPDGSYRYSFETQNGIAAEQQGVVKALGDQTAPVVVQGFYRYTSPEGIPVEVRYTADEFGYHPRGTVIPGPGQAFPYKNAVIPPAQE